jgi:hypothetical protein
MAIRCEGHLPMAMQRHTGSVKDESAKSAKRENDTRIPLVPEYGDPLWLIAGAPAGEVQRSNERQTPN